MKLFIKIWLVCVLLISPFCLKANEPDSVYLFAYSTAKSNGHSGLCYAWSTDRVHWNPLGPERCFLFCDYGRWGSQKRMLNPYLYYSRDGYWHCVWSVNEDDGVVAYARSANLITWTPQIYPVLMQSSNCLETEIFYNEQSRGYSLSWLGRDGIRRGAFTSDFKKFVKGDRDLTCKSNREKIFIGNESEVGSVNKVSWALVKSLADKCLLDDYKAKLYAENPADDIARWPDIKPLNATLKVFPDNKKSISNRLIGVFFEDINYAADGGLYAEMIQNRDFEYSLSDKEGRDRTWNATKAWSWNKSSLVLIDSVSPIHLNNKHYAVFKVDSVGSVLRNEGFDGIAIKRGEIYDFSIFLRSSNITRVLVRLVDADGAEVGSLKLNTSQKWKRQQGVFVAKKTVSNAHLEIQPCSVGVVDVDFVSLFPQKTFMNRKNGLRADLAQLVADIHPKFVRFPGGCVAHGDGLLNIYRWKNTIGDLEVRKPMRNLWGYHQSMGLGYYEYFQFCEDIGAEPLPVVAAGVPCQNSAVGGAGQQGGIAMCDMDQYVQDILDLIEWANGDEHSYWGHKRAMAGHIKPFNLKYIGVGNEDLITDIFEERFTAIYNAVKAKYPDITIVGTVGPNSEGTDYVEGWNVASRLKVPIVDEHYYQSMGWFIHNQDFYDRYDRSKSKVYLGEYASRGNTLANALTEALYLLSVERNADVVEMTSYAPLLAKAGHTQWNPDMIYFTNSDARLTPNYYVQKMFGRNSGNYFLHSDLDLQGATSEWKRRVACSVVTDGSNGDLIMKVVNLLPVEVKLSVNPGLPVLPLAEAECLSGEVNAKALVPTMEKVDVSGNFQLIMAPYSFKVVRMKKVNR